MMPAFGGFDRGQVERISRGERTDPRVVIGQAIGLSAVSMALILLVMAAIMLNVGTTWRYIGENWRWLILFLILPWAVGCVIAGWVLFIEVFDPNYPAPRKALDTSRVVWPTSKERVMPPQQAPASSGHMRGHIDFGLDGDDTT